MSSSDNSTDQKLETLIGEVAARTGIKLARDDPAFALVALNQLVLRAEVGQLVGEVRHSIAEFEKTADAIQARAGAAVGKALRECLNAVRKHQPVARTSLLRSTFLVLGGVLIGMTVGAELWMAPFVR